MGAGVGDVDVGMGAVTPVVGGCGGQADRAGWSAAPECCQLLKPLAWCCGCHRGRPFCFTIKSYTMKGS